MLVKVRIQEIGKLGEEYRDFFFNGQKFRSCNDLMRDSGSVMGQKNTRIEKQLLPH